MFESIKKPLNPNQTPGPKNTTDEEIPGLVSGKLYKAQEHLAQTIGSVPPSIKLEGSEV
mgnify:CR=1 FL=1